MKMEKGTVESISWAFAEALERPLWLFEGHLFKVAALCYPCM